MMKWLTKFFKGFTYAFHGIMEAVQGRNMRVHMVAFVVAVLAGVYFQLQVWEWIAILLISGAVMSAEVMNSALEDVCNTLRDTLGVSYEGTKVARDMAAGAVLLLAITAVLVAVLIFGPRIVAVF